MGTRHIPITVKPQLSEFRLSEHSIIQTLHLGPCIYAYVNKQPRLPELSIIRMFFPGPSGFGSSRLYYILPDWVCSHKNTTFIKTTRVHCTTNSHRAKATFTDLQSASNKKDCALTCSSIHPCGSPHISSVGCYFNQRNLPRVEAAGQGKRRILRIPLYTWHVVKSSKKKHAQKKTKKITKSMQKKGGTKWEREKWAFRERYVSLPVGTPFSLTEHISCPPSWMEETEADKVIPITFMHPTNSPHSHSRYVVRKANREWATTPKWIVCDESCIQFTHYFNWRISSCAAPPLDMLFLIKPSSVHFRQFARTSITLRMPQFIQPWFFFHIRVWFIIHWHDWWDFQKSRHKMSTGVVFYNSQVVKCKDDQLPSITLYQHHRLTPTSNSLDGIQLVIFTSFSIHKERNCLTWDRTHTV